MKMVGTISQRRVAEGEDLNSNKRLPILEITEMIKYADKLGIRLLLLKLCKHT